MNVFPLFSAVIRPSHRTVSALLLTLLLLAQGRGVWAESPFAKMKEAINKRAGVTTLQNSNSFGVGWKPKPLVDHTPKPVTTLSPAASTKPVAAVNPSTEAFLKPMVPFISSVEKELLINPGSTQSIQGRLDNLQSVLFGDKVYPNPSDALAKIAALYPAQAAQSRQQLISDMQKKTLSPRAVHMPNGKAPFPGTQKATYGYSSGGYSSGASSSGGSSWPVQTPTYSHPTPSAPQFNTNGGTTSINRPIVRPLYQQKSMSPPSQNSKSGWKSLLSSTDEDFWGGKDPFDDPFFKDNASQPAPQQAYQQPQAPSMATSGAGVPPVGVSGQTYHQYVPKAPKPPSAAGNAIRALGQGVLGLASIAAPVAGSYYLNKATGGTNHYSTYPNQYYGPGYGYGAYGLPGQYANLPYATPYPGQLGYQQTLPGYSLNGLSNNGLNSLNRGLGTSVASTRLAVPRLAVPLSVLPGLTPPLMGVPQLRTAPNTYYAPGYGGLGYGYGSGSVYGPVYPPPRGGLWHW